MRPPITLVKASTSLAESLLCVMTPRISPRMLRTRFAQVVELREGKIVALRNYDCFYPW